MPFCCPAEMAGRLALYDKVKPSLKFMSMGRGYHYMSIAVFLMKWHSGFMKRICSSTVYCKFHFKKVWRVFKK